MKAALEAMNSIDPAWRVFVGASGVVQVFRVQHRRSDAWMTADGMSPWPSDPSLWLQTANDSTNTIWRRCRTGWLHTDEGDADESLLRKAGEPIIDVLSPRMLTNKIWWRE